VLKYAGEAFSRSAAERKVLIVFSDARNFSRELDRETPSTIDVAKSLARLERQQLFADLKSVEVLLLGAGDHSGKRGTAYTSSLNQFWTAFVKRSGGRLVLFSPTREVDALRLVTTVPVPNRGRP
jgi:hypothetical protein